MELLKGEEGKGNGFGSWGGLSGLGWVVFNLVGWIKDVGRLKGNWALSLWAVGGVN